MHGVRCEVVYGTAGVESCVGVGCEVVYGTNGVESCIGMGCEVVYGTDGVESCICDEMSGREWTRWCRIVYGAEM